MREMKHWTDNQMNYLKQNYKSKGALFCSYYLNRTKKSVINKAHRLNLMVDLKVSTQLATETKKKNAENYKYRKYCCRICLDKLKEQILKDYFKGCSLNQISKDIGLKQTNTVRLHLLKWGINIRNINYGFKKWTNYEIEYLKKAYFEEDRNKMIKKLKRSWNAIIHKAHNVGIKRNREHFRQIGIRKFNKYNNPAKRPEIRKLISMRMTKYIKDNPEKMLNRILRRNHMTSIERRMKKILDKNNLSYKYNYYVKTNKSYRFPDFLIQNLIIECDGSRFHNDKKKESARDRELIEQGYYLLHFSEGKINNNPEVVEKCILKRLNQLNIQAGRTLMT
ncbi:MAG: DUF559 domain-containing protein [Kosmotogaceae bacterium]